MSGVREVLPDEYLPMSSEYLRSGRRNEVWSINWVRWDGEVLLASARLDGWQGSETDASRFHVSIFAVREMDAQLAIIGMHLRLGLARKTTEVWLLKCAEECLAALTVPDDVRFEMRFSFRKTSSGKLIYERMSEITDARGGMIKLTSNGLMAWREEMGALPDDLA